MTPEGNCSPSATTTPDWQEISAPAVMAKIPLVSVHMITYNHEAYIAAAIEGVLQQETTFPIELVIGEDCSTDRTRDIVDEYQSRHPDTIRIITSEKNVGGHKNYLRTVNACRGKYIAYCEGDDYWHHPQKLQIQVDYLETHPQYGLVHSEITTYTVNDDRTITASYRCNQQFHDQTDILYSLIIGEYKITTCTVVAQTEMIRDILHQSSLGDSLSLGDLQTWIEVAHRSSLKYFDEPLATYNILPVSASKPKSLEAQAVYWRDCMDIRLYYAHKYGGDKSTEMARTIVERAKSQGLVFAYKTHTPTLARTICDLASKYHIRLTPRDHIRRIGSQSPLAYHVVEILLRSLRLARRFFSNRFLP